MSISIFAKPTSRTSRGPGGHLQRVSSMIRGVQIAEQIGAKLNPESGYEDDICIYVKPHVPKGYDFDFKTEKSYLDIVDGHNLGQVLLKHPEVPAIVCSLADYEVMCGVYDKEGEIIKNKIILIPQHHCNFDRLRRKRKKVSTVGVIGTAKAFDFLPDGLEEGLVERGMELVKFSQFFSRQDVVDFYMGVDVQIVWRPYKTRLGNPLKIVNAASFGIPTIALRERVFKEMDGYYLPVSTLEEFFDRLDELRGDAKLYARYSSGCYEKAEQYHIEKIGEMYKRYIK